MGFYRTPAGVGSGNSAVEVLGLGPRRRWPLRRVRQSSIQSSTAGNMPNRSSVVAVAAASMTSERIADRLGVSSCSLVPHLPAGHTGYLKECHPLVQRTDLPHRDDPGRAGGNSNLLSAIEIPTRLPIGSITNGYTKGLSVIATTETPISAMKAAQWIGLSVRRALR